MPWVRGIPVWEYRTAYVLADERGTWCLRRRVRHTHYSQPVEWMQEQLEDGLYNLGLDGWELIASHPVSDPSDEASNEPVTRFIFKRKAWTKKATKEELTLYRDKGQPPPITD